MTQPEPLSSRTPGDQPATRRELRELERRGARRRKPALRAKAAPASASPAPGRRRARPTAAASRDARRAARRPARPEAGAAARPARRSFGSKLLSLAVLMFVPALAIGMSLPANAFYSTPEEPELAAQLTMDAAQTLAISADVVDADATSERSDWNVLSWAQVLQQRYGTTDYSYSPSNGSIRWPFPYEVPITDGFGARLAPCMGCSTYHEGVDFVPGLGAAIYAIADGVVTSRNEAHWSYGNEIVITHHIDGHTVTSRYAHMQHGSSPIVLGQQIEVGDFLGLVGQTGQATGPHLHFEISVDGVMVNPYSWLKAHAN